MGTEVVIRGEIQKEAEHREIRAMSRGGKKIIKRKLESSKKDTVIKG